jgi:hypothetical protein
MTMSSRDSTTESAPTTNPGTGNAANYDNGTTNYNDNNNDNDNDNDNCEDTGNEDDLEDDDDRTDTRQHTNNNDNTNSQPPRKRSKVSRACDACRRKKVKCDATFDTDSKSITKICTNCAKINEECTFTRIPLKRGPNKGYKLQSQQGTIAATPSSSSSTASNSSTKIVKRQGRSRKSSLVDVNNIPSRVEKKRQFPILPQPQPPMQAPHIGAQSPNSHISNIILPPFNALSYPSMQSSDLSQPHQQPTQNQMQHSTSQQAQAQQSQEIFWKVPTAMPSFNTNSFVHSRKGSVDSTHSSISSASSLSSDARQMIMSNSKSSIIGGMENSDSEDEFFSNNSNKFQRRSFQTPMTTQERSPRVSFTSDRERSSISSILSASSIGSFERPTVTPQANLTEEQQQQQQQQPPGHEIFGLLDAYYGTLYQQYPVLPHPEILRISVSSLLQKHEFEKVIEVFATSLRAISVSNLNTDKKVYINFKEISKAFELLVGWFLSKSVIYSSMPAKVVLTSTLTLLNYGIVMSGYDYSLGFGISFSYFKDWLIFKEGYESPSFSNLIQLVVLDNIHTLYFGIPRSSTICFAIDSTFIDMYLKETKFVDTVELEWLSIGLHLVVLNNNLQQLDTIDKLSEIDVTGTKYKFMLIIKLYYDLFVYVRNINVQGVINEFKATNNGGDISRLNEYLDSYIYNVELDITKLCKKITNIIDEQLDDLELTNPNVLISLILAKCLHISMNTEIILKSVIHLNKVLQPIDAKKGNSSGLSSLSNLNDTTNNDNRSRSSSMGSSVDTLNNVPNSPLTLNGQNNRLSGCSDRIGKLIGNIQSNGKRCTQYPQIHDHCRELLGKLQRQHFETRVEITVPRTVNSGGIEYTVVLQNWARLVNTHFTGEITKEGINGWSYM